MSDNEDFMMSDGGEEDYDFEFESDAGSEDANSGERDVENDYYVAKALKEDSMKSAVEAFGTIVQREEEKTEWGFKCLKQMTKIYFKELKDYTKALETYRQLLPYTESVITKNYSERTINGILDYISVSTGQRATDEARADTVEQFYFVTRTALKKLKNEKLAVKTEMKLAKLFVDRQTWKKLVPTLQSLKGGCKTVDGVVDQASSTMLMEIYSMEIQMYDHLNDTRNLRRTYLLSQSIKSALPHPRILGIIRECGGKMHMNEKNFTSAQNDFFEAFRSYDEAGAQERIRVLQYLVLAHILNHSGIDPFDSPETKAYKEDPQITAILNLIELYKNRNVAAAERAMSKNKDKYFSDPFIEHHLNDVLSELRKQYVQQISGPYTRMSLSMLASVGLSLSISMPDVEQLITEMILEGVIKGSMDQVQGELVLDRPVTLESRKISTLSALSSQLGSLRVQSLSKLSRLHQSSQVNRRAFQNIEALFSAGD